MRFSTSRGQAIAVSMGLIFSGLFGVAHAAPDAVSRSLTLQVEHKQLLVDELINIQQDLKAKMRPSSAERLPYAWVKADQRAGALSVIAEKADVADTIADYIKRELPQLSVTRAGKSVVTARFSAEIEAQQLEVVMEQVASVLRARMAKVVDGNTFRQSRAKQRVIPMNDCQLLVLVPDGMTLQEAAVYFTQSASVGYYAVAAKRSLTEKEARKRNMRVLTSPDGREYWVAAKPVVTGLDIVSATQGHDASFGSFALSVTLTESAGQKMSVYTRESIGTEMGMVYRANATADEKVMSVATIQGAFGRRFQTTGITEEEAKRLAEQLGSRALKVPLTVVTPPVVKSKVVTPTVVTPEQLPEHLSNNLPSSRN